MVIFDGGGLPGGFGAAPFWSDTVEPGETTVSVAPLTDERRDLNYTVEPADRDGCVRIEGTDAIDKYGLQTLPLAVVGGPFVLCQDRPLPVQFTTVTGDTYTLQGRRPGDRTVEAANGSAWTRPGHPFPRRSWTEPFAVSDRERTKLSLQEAHQVALDDSPAYRRLFEESAHPLVVATGTSVPMSGSGPVPGGVGDSKTYRRGLVAVASDGRGVNVTVEKTIHGGPQPNETRVVEEVNVSMEPTPTRATLPGELVEVDDVARVAEAISGLPLSIKGRTGVGPTLFPGHYPITEATNFHFETNFDWRWGLTDSLTVLPWLKDPNPDGMIHTPYHASADGASGHLEAIEVNRTRMPLSDPPALPWADGT